MRLLVTGVNGLLGSNVASTAVAYGWDFAGTYHSDAPAFDAPLHRLDVVDDGRFADVVREHQPDAVVNCAAMTDVDECERNPERASRVNATAPGELARIAASVDAAFVHVSTDYVFSGDADRPYRESDVTAPRQTYGRSKLAGERAIREVHGSPLIVRPSFLYGRHGATGALVGFPAWVRDRLANGETVPLFTDQHVTPSRAGQAAETIADLLVADATGTYHVASRSCVTPYEFGDEVRARVGADRDSLAASTRSSTNGAADRPRSTCLDVRAVEEALGRQQPTLGTDLGAIEESLRDPSYD